jgi:putative transposase
MEKPVLTGFPPGSPGVSPQASIATPLMAWSENVLLIRLEASKKIMSENSYSEINLHMTWHTKSSLPLIEPEIETKLHAVLRHKILITGGAYFHAVGGTENHVHLVVSIEPELSISDLIGQLKGSSSYYINKLVDRKLLEWQRGYGVVSFGTRDLPWVVNYVLNQKEHHRKGATFERLEKRVFGLTG